MMARALETDAPSSDIQLQISAGFVVVGGQNQLSQSYREEKRTEWVSLLNS